jgi:hypothetical protein
MKGKKNVCCISGCKTIDSLSLASIITLSLVYFCACAEKEKQKRNIFTKRKEIRKFKCKERKVHGNAEDGAKGKGNLNNIIVQASENNCQLSLT